MAPDRWITMECLYHGALDRDPTERSEWLRQACGADVELLAEVESLLACDASLSNPAARPELSELWNRMANRAGIASETPLTPATKVTLPSFIGPYRILRLVGEGGMGVVYEAEQKQPRRIVALKVIKPGLGSPELLRRLSRNLWRWDGCSIPASLRSMRPVPPKTGLGRSPISPWSSSAASRYSSTRKLTS
jgi:eukaryotic-like serine/threonine-protein kinase